VLQNEGTLGVDAFWRFKVEDQRILRGGGDESRYGSLRYLPKKKKRKFAARPFKQDLGKKETITSSKKKL